MAHRSEPPLLVLHGLRLKGFADSAALARLFGLGEAATDGLLAELADKDLVRHREGRLSGWSLTPAGREEHRRLVAEELEVSGAREVVDDAYHVFLRINPELLSTCTAWQLKAAAGRQVPNDHSDADYDAGVLRRLRAVDDRVQPLCVRLGGVLDRLAVHGPRLASALTRVEAGQGEWLTKPMIDSYHSVWFELHEDLLVTLGLERAREGA